MTIKISREYADFIDDVGGFLWAMRDAQHMTWTAVALNCDLSTSTVLKLANRVTQNPQTYTVWKIFRAFDKASLIRHSELEKYRHMGRPKKPKLKVVA